jgi:hypothetical protein
MTPLYVVALSTLVIVSGITVLQHVLSRSLRTPSPQPLRDADIAAAVAEAGRIARAAAQAGRRQPRCWHCWHPMALDGRRRYWHCRAPACRRGLLPVRVWKPRT